MNNQKKLKPLIRKVQFCPNQSPTSLRSGGTAHDLQTPGRFRVSRIMVLEPQRSSYAWCFDVQKDIRDDEGTLNSWSECLNAQVNMPIKLKRKTLLDLTEKKKISPQYDELIHEFYCNSQYVGIRAIFSHGCIAQQAALALPPPDWRFKKTSWSKLFTCWLMLIVYVNMLKYVDKDAFWHSGSNTFFSDRKTIILQCCKLAQRITGLLKSPPASQIPRGVGKPQLDAFFSWPLGCEQPLLKWPSSTCAICKERVKIVKSLILRYWFHWLPTGLPKIDRVNHWKSKGLHSCHNNRHLKISDLSIIFLRKTAPKRLLHQLLQDGSAAVGIQILASGWRF